MRDPQDDLLQAVSADDLLGIRAAVAAGADPNARDEGASVLHWACIHGNLEVVRTLLDLGGDPNVHAEPPADEILDPTPLETVISARFLMDWAKYDPILDLLVIRGARDSDGAVPDPARSATPRWHALLWQKKGVAWGPPRWLWLLTHWRRR